MVASSLLHLPCTRLLLLFYCFASASSAAVPAIYVFGDSLVDVGNNNYLAMSVIKADFPHYGVDYPGRKATGRFSNGKNPADFLAEKLGLPASPPYLSISSVSNKTRAYLGGVSFASGGAGILDSTKSGQCLTFNKQIEYFTKMYTFLVQKVSSAQVLDHLSKSIFSVVIGSNDILGYSRSSGGLTPQQFVDSMITELRGQLKGIYNLGARKFAFIGPGPIGCAPGVRLNNGTGDCNTQANAISLMYAQGAASLLKELQSELPGLNYSFFNASVTMLQYLQNPSPYGFTEVKAACCGHSILNTKIPCLPVFSLCPNRTNHVFWDLFHPSEATSRLLTETFFGGSVPFVYPINAKQLIDV